MDTAKSIQQSNEQYNHPYGAHCHLLRSWDDFQDLITNANVNRLVEFNKYLNAVFMSKDDQKIVLNSFKMEATIHKFEHTHFLIDKCLSVATGGAGVPVMLLGKKKIVVNGVEKNIHDIIFKDPSVKMTYYQRAILLDYEDFYFCSKDALSCSRQKSFSHKGYSTHTYAFGSAFYVYNHPDYDVNDLVNQTLKVHLLGESNNTNKSALQRRFQSLSRFHGIMSKQMPKIPKYVQDVENNMQYSPGTINEDLPYYTANNFIPSLWTSVTETNDNHHGVFGVSRLSTLRQLRDGHSICNRYVNSLNTIMCEMITLYLKSKC